MNQKHAHQNQTQKIPSRSQAKPKTRTGSPHAEPDYSYPELFNWDSEPHNLENSLPIPHILWRDVSIPSVVGGRCCSYDFVGLSRLCLPFVQILTEVKHDKKHMCSHSCIFFQPSDQNINGLQRTYKVSMALPVYLQYLSHLQPWG